MTRENFAERVTAAQGRLYRVARGYLRQEADCLDAVSEAIARAWQKLATLREERYFDTWLMRILIRECVNIQRRQKRVAPMETLPERASIPSENEALRAALRKTPLEGDSPAARGVENLLARLENPKQKLWDWNPAPPPQAGRPFLWRRRKA